jgi:putative endonuclease
MVGQDAQIAVYIMASGRNGRSTPAPPALLRRVQQHKLGLFEGFSKDHGCKSLVWYEDQTSMTDAIVREKRIKRWRRDWKLALIEADNSHWRDLSDGWFDLADGPLSWAQRPQL